MTKQNYDREIKKMIKEYLKPELDVFKNIDDNFWQKGYPKMEKRLLEKVFNIYNEAYEQGHATGVVVGDKIDKAIKNDKAPKI